MATYLSKSRLLSLRQCPLRLWNEINRRELAQEIDVNTQFRFDEGTRVGELARERYPKGMLIQAEYWDFEKAMDQTLQLLNDSSVPALFEAAFIADRTRVRSDILLRKGKNTWEMWEVKSVLNTKDIHILDVGIQAETAKRWAHETGFNLNITRAGILHLNRDYIYTGGKHDLQALFTESDMTPEIETYRSEIDTLVGEGIRVIDNPESPSIQPGPHCTDPYGCPFLGTACSIPEPEELTFIPRIRKTTIDKLKDKGIVGICDISVNDPDLNNNQLRVVKAWQSEETQTEASLTREIQKIGYPRYHLDFETFAPVIPRYTGTRPFQAIPFQFSIHIERSERDIDHLGYLHDQDTDPRLPLTDNLLRILESMGNAPILCYSGYEKRIITELSDHIPSLSPRLEALNERLVDLLPIVRNNVYNKGFEGSFSIKNVLPTLVPSLGYSGLDIADGTMASLKYLEMLELINSGNDESISQIDKIKNDLWLYCKRDTEAMVALMNALAELSMKI